MNLSRSIVALVLLTAGAAGAGDLPAPPKAPLGMVYIAPGEYEPLFKSEGKKAVSAFFMDRHPVTNAEYLDFVKVNPKWRKSRVRRIFADHSYLTKWVSDDTPGPDPEKSLNSPVVHISWHAARAYAKWKGKRIPSQAEWEYAASASKTKPNGKEDPDHYRYILDWYSRPTPKVMPAVGSTYKNYWGLYDMHGLVWEWVSDFNTALVTGESRGDAGLERQLFCGSGSVGASDFKDYAAFMRYALRSSLEADFTTANLGFRCAKSINIPKKKD